MTSLGNWAASARAATVAAARTSFSALVVTAVAAAGLTAVTAAGPAGAAATHRAAAHHRAAPGTGPAGDEGTVSQNDLRNGWDQNEPTLTPAAVQGGQFGQIFKTSVNGQVYGQPLVVGNTLVVATENDWVYGLNATTGAVLWKTSLGTPYHITSCSDLTPNIGVTSTGVYDPSTGTVYEMGLVHEINHDRGPSPQDFFSPSNAPSLDSSDTDFGSGGPTGLPFGTSTYPDILMQAGKFGTIYLLNRVHLGGRNSADQDRAKIGPIAAPACGDRLPPPRHGQSG
jgi:hypothetical protein